MLADTIKLPELRDYQLKGLQLLRQAFLDGHRKIVLDAATGSGKGVWYIHLVHNGLLKDKRVLLVMKRRQLVFQTSDRFSKCGIRNSIIMGNEKGFNPAIPFQICSIDTISNRDPEFFKSFNVVIVDECHDTTSPTYRKFLESFLPGTLFVGLTATLFKVGKKYQDFWDCAVRPIEAYQLVEKGYLVPCELYVPEKKIDVTGIKISSLTGDYDTKELSIRASKLEVIGDIVEGYKKFCDGEPAIAFCVDKAHAISLADEFNYRGIPAASADESTPQKERDSIIDNLKKGIIKVITNVNIFSTGVDIPEASAGLMCRPTRSEILWIQQCGRIFRPFRKCGKCNSQYDNSPKCYLCGFDRPSFIKRSGKIIDFANNYSRLNHPYDIRYPQIKPETEDQQKKREEKLKPISKNCKKCFRPFEARFLNCPYCLTEDLDLPSELFKTKKGEIVPYDDYTEVLNYFNRLLNDEKFKAWNANAKYFKLYDKFGDRCMKFSKDFEIPEWIPKSYKKSKEKEIGAAFYK